MKKTINPYSYKMIISDISDGNGEAFEVYMPAFNAHHFGDTIKDAIKSYYIYFESEKVRRKKLKISMPKPDLMYGKIKQVPLRIPETVYEKIANMAENKGQSFNRFVTSLLENAA